jgi:4-hydroxy-tetrahydrodipicolinate reductase
MRHSQNMTKIIIAGARGKMGQALLRVAEKIPGLAVTARIERGQELGNVIHDADVVVDFSAHEATIPFACLCAQHKKGMVIGTTGHTESERKELLNLSAQVPMVWSSNFSTGVNALFWLTGNAVGILGPDYDLEIVEMHHRSKKDAPSGTAKNLAQILARARHCPASEIGVHSLRGGDVVGDHTVIFATAGERLELTHKASSRETFASGALRAAQWIIGKAPGVYDMQDVLGLK